MFARSSLLTAGNSTGSDVYLEVRVANAEGEVAAYQDVTADNTNDLSRVQSKYQRLAQTARSTQATAADMEHELEVTRDGLADAQAQIVSARVWMCGCGCVCVCT